MQQRNIQLRSSSNPCRPVVTRCRNNVFRNRRVQVAATAAVETAPAQQGQAQQKGYKDALLVQCQWRSAALLSKRYLKTPYLAVSKLLFAGHFCSFWLGQL